MGAAYAGHGLWLDRGQQQCLILWKTLDVWAQTIYEWARNSGLQDSVMTIDELSSGDEVQGTGDFATHEFLHEAIWQQSIGGRPFEGGIQLE